MAFYRWWFLFTTIFCLAMIPFFIRFLQTSAMTRSSSIAQRDYYVYGTGRAALERDTVGVSNTRTSNNLNLMTFNNIAWKVNNSVCSNIDTLKGEFNFQKAPLKTLNGTVQIYLNDPKSDLVSQQVTRKQAHEYFVYRIIYKFIRNEPEVNFIDFGANLGLFTLQVAALNRHVISVEASYECVQHECASVLENKFQDKVTIVHNALGADHTDAKFYVQKQPGGDYGISFVETKDNEFDRHQTIFKTQPFKRNSIVIKSVILDDLLTLPNFQKTFKKSFIKIDIEGLEHTALKGAETFFKVIEVRGIYMEWMYHKNRDSATYIMEKLAAWGFVSWDCDIVFDSQFFVPPIDKPCRRIDLSKCNKRCPNNVVWLPNARETN